MTVYYWYSETLKNYGNGHIIAIGDDIETAKENAYKDFLSTFNELFVHLDSNDSDDHDEIYEKKKMFRRDLAKKPKIISSSLFIKGSD